MAAFQFLLIDASNELTSGGDHAFAFATGRISNDANNVLDKAQLGLNWNKPDWRNESQVLAV